MLKREILQISIILSLVFTSLAYAAKAPEDILKMARQDAKHDVNENFWALAAFGGTTACSFAVGIPILAAAYFYQPAPPAHRFIGMNPEYVEAYTQVWKSEYQRYALRGTLLGCLGGGTINYFYLRSYPFSQLR